VGRYDCLVEILFFEQADDGKAFARSGTDEWAGDHASGVKASAELSASRALPLDESIHHLIIRRVLPTACTVAWPLGHAAHVHIAAAAATAPSAAPATPSAASAVATREVRERLTATHRFRLHVPF
jgi:hypothetical protein